MSKQTCFTALSNPLQKFLDKPSQEFTRADMLRAIEHFEIKQLTFHYTGLDGKLHELNLPFSELPRAEQLLAMGERVDGSSLFKGVVDPAKSDLYVVPKYSSAFLSPFVENSLDFICRFVDSEGKLAAFPPDNVLELAAARLTKNTGYTLRALGELEFYLIDGVEPNDYYPIEPQAGYHASLPFFKNNNILREMTDLVQQCTGAVKYSHAEVGYIPNLVSHEETLNNHRAEQYEIEMLPTPIADMGDHLVLARWIIRNVAAQYGMLATFAPKLMVGMAGSGYHVHVELCKDGQNAMLTDGKINEVALRTIGGLTRYAQELSAFGNTVAASYMRLVPHQEAPTRICWSYSNRSSLVRIPLGWRNATDLSRLVNAQQDEEYHPYTGSQTVELRSPDGSAHTYMLLAGMTTAIEWGLTSPEALDYAEGCRIDGDVNSSPKRDSLLELPQSCDQSAQMLEEHRAYFDEFGVFPKELIDHAINVLRNEKDSDLDVQLNSLSIERAGQLRQVVMHRGIHRY